MKREYLFVLSLSFCAALTLQVACLPALARYTLFQPQCLVVLLIIMATGRAALRPELIGFLFGLALDLISSSRTGTYALLFTLLACAVNESARRVPVSHLIVFEGYVLVFGTFYFVSALLLGSLTHQGLGGGLWALFIFSFSNAAVAPLFYFFLRTPLRLPYAAEMRISA